MGCFAILFVLAIWYGALVLIAWGLIASINFFGANIPDSASHIYVAGLILFVLSVLTGSIKIKY